MLLIPLGVFLATTLVIYCVARWFTRKGRSRDAEVLTRNGRRSRLFGRATNAIAALLPIGEKTKATFTRFLHRAGFYHRAALSEFLALRNVLVVGWLLLMLGFIVASTVPGEPAMYLLGMVGLAGAVIFFAIPRLILEMRAKARIQRIEETMPDALDMVSMCMIGGLPLQHSITRVSQELKPVHPDVAFELCVLGRQMETASSEQAMNNFADRLDTPEIRSLAGIIRQTEKQGSSVADAFQCFADNVRQSRRQRAEELGNKASIKMLFPMIFCLAPPVYLLLLSPAVMELSNFVQRERSGDGVLASSTENLDSVFGSDYSGLGDVGATTNELNEALLDRQSR